MSGRESSGEMGEKLEGEVERHWEGAVNKMAES